MIVRVLAAALATALALSLAVPPFAGRAAAAAPIRIVVNGVVVATDVEPQTVGGRVLVPARFIAEPLGAKVEFDSQSQRVIITSRQALQAGRVPEPPGGQGPSAQPAASAAPGIAIFVDGVDVKSDVAPQAIGGRVMVPARFVAEPLGATVEWNGDERAVLVRDAAPFLEKFRAQVARTFQPDHVFLYDLDDWDDQSLVDLVHADSTGGTHQGRNGSLEYFAENNLALVKGPVDKAHAMGLKRFIHYHQNSPDVDRDEELAYDIDGNVGHESFDPRVTLTTIHSRYRQQKIIDWAKRMVDVGVDGVCLDGFSFAYDYAMWGQADFSPASVAGFRDYLLATYGADKLRRDGIPDPTTLDYRVFIKENYYSQYQSDRLRIPYYRDFVEFQYRTERDFHLELIRQLREYAATKGKKFLVSLNASESYDRESTDLGKNLGFWDQLDWFSTEITYEMPRENKEMSVYKVFSATGRPAGFIPNAGFNSAEMQSRPDAAELTKVFTAEAYATGNFYYAPNANTLMDSKGEWKVIGADLTQLAGYYDFIENNRTALTDLVPAGNIGVVFPQATIRNQRFEPDQNLAYRDFNGISLALLESHRPYEVVIAGDGVWADDKFSLDDLRRFEMVVLPGMRDLRASQAEALMAYLRGGGKVLAFGATAENDENGRRLAGGATAGSELASLSTPGTHRVGFGFLTYVAADLGQDYLAGRKDGAWAALSGAIKEFKVRTIETTADEYVTFNQYVKGGVADRATVLHMVNYDYDDARGAIVPKLGVKVRVPLGGAAAGGATSGLAVLSVSPDREGIETLSATMVDGYLEFTVPRLDYWNVLLIGDQAPLEANWWLERLGMEQAKAADGADLDYAKGQAAQVAKLIAEGRHAEATGAGRAAVQEMKGRVARGALDQVGKLLPLWEKQLRDVSAARRAYTEAERLFQDGQYDQVERKSWEARTLAAIKIDGYDADWTGIPDACLPGPGPAGHGTTPGVKMSLANDTGNLYVRLSRPGLTYKTYIDIRFTYDDGVRPNYSLSVHQGDVEVLDLIHDNKSIGYGAKEVADVLEVKIPFSLIGRPGRIAVDVVAWEDNQKSFTAEGRYTVVGE
jgi:hypothetical protein